MAKLKKLKRQERAKIKLKEKKLPKGQNVTDTSFKTRKIVIPGQLQSPKEGEIYTKKKLNVSELISHLRHHNVSMRREGVNGLNELVTLHGNDIINLHLPRMFDAVCSLILDPESDVRKSAMKLFETILTQVSYEQIEPHFNVLRTYMSCAMTHINRAIREDSLLLLDNLLNVCPSLVTKKAGSVLPPFLNMISNVRNESERNRKLSVDLESKLSGVKWRMKVFARMTKYFAAIVASEKRDENSGGGQKECTELVDTTESSTRSVKWDKHFALYAAEFLSFAKEVCYLPNVFSQYSHEPVPQLTQQTTTIPQQTTVEKDENECKFTFGQDTTFKEEIVGLVTVLYQSWIEVAPRLDSADVSVLSQEAAVMLQYVVETFLHIWNCVNDWEEKANMKNLTRWFIAEFGRDILRAFLPGFPYRLQENVFKAKGVQTNRIQSKHNGILRQDLSLAENMKSLNPRLIQQNLYLAYLFTQIHKEKSVTVVEPVLRFVKSCVADFENMELLPIFEKVLRAVLEKSWHTKELLQVVALRNQNLSVNKELRQIFFVFLCDSLQKPAENTDLGNKEFEGWVSEMPHLIFQTDVSIKVLRALQLLSCQNHRKFVSSLKRRAKTIIRSMFEIRITGTSKPIEGQKAIIDMLFPIADEEMFSGLLNTIASSENLYRGELITYVNNLKALSEYLSL